MSSLIDDKFLHCQTCPISRRNSFNLLPIEVLNEFSHCKSSTFYKRRQVIFHQGQHPYGVYCIGQGKIKESIGTPHGKNYIARISQAGDLLGLHSLLRKEAYEVTAEAMEDSVICFLDQTVFNKALLNYPQFTQHFMVLLCQELRISIDKSVELAYNTLPQRVAELLLVLNSHFGESIDKGSYINISITRKELASMLGTTEESVVRELSRLQENGVLSNYKRHLIINNLESLYAQAS